MQIMTCSSNIMVEASMTDKNAANKILSNDPNYCSLCLQNILEEYWYNLQDEVVFDNKITDVCNILITVLGTNVFDNITSTLICQKCTENAINSYKFIKMCRNNFHNLSSTANILLELSKKLSINDNSSYKSVILAFDKDKCQSGIYYDTKRCKQKLHILKRYQYLQTKEEKEIKYENNNNKHKDISNKKVRKARVNQKILLSDILYKTPDHIGYKCKTCFKNHISARLLRQHYLRIHAPKDFKCSHCPRSFGSSILLNSHMKYSHTSTPTICSQCGKTYTNIYSLREHEKTHKIRLVCQACGKVYKGKRSYNNHIKQKMCQMVTKVKKDPKFTCNYCQKKYSHKTSLYIHIRLEHENGKAFVCDWCGKKLASLSGLNEHIVKHTKQKNFECDICGGKFVSKMSLIYHTRLHTGEKPYKCEHCEMSFLSASRRSEHTKRHHSEHNLECDICHRKFKTRPCLRKHRKRHFNMSSRLYLNMPLQSKV